MEFVSPAFKWLNKKYFKANENLVRFKLKVTFSETINFLVHYPTSDKHSLIKEYVNKEWSQEVSLLDPTKIYVRVFLTTNNIIKEVKLKLEIEQIVEEDTAIKISDNFLIGESHNYNNWLQIKWLDQDV